LLWGNDVSVSRLGWSLLLVVVLLPSVSTSRETLALLK
jgi:hypothetical protein